MKRALLGIVGALVSALALALAFVRVSTTPTWHLEAKVAWADLVRAMKSASPWWLLVFTVFNALSLLPRAFELRALARRRDGAPPSLKACWHAQAVGQLAQNLLPARMGEAARVVTLVRADDISPVTAVAAAVLGRVLDLISLVLVTCVPSLLLPVGRIGPLRAVALSGSLIGVALTLACALAWRRRDALAQLGARIGPRTARALGGFGEGLSALGSARRLAAASLASLAAPLVIAACYGSALRAFGLGDLPAGSSLVLAATVLLAIAVPAGPSSVGVYEAAVTWLLPALGATPASAAAFAIATHALGVVTFVLLGTPSLYAVGATLLPTEDV